MNFSGQEILQQSDLSKLSTDALLELYNKFSLLPPRRFASRAAGLRRVWSLIQDQAVAESEKPEAAEVTESASTPSAQAIQELTRRAAPVAAAEVVEEPLSGVIEISERTVRFQVARGQEAQSAAVALGSRSAAALVAPTLAPVAPVPAAVEPREEAEPEPADKPRRSRRGSGMSFRMAPRAEGRIPRAGSKRELALQLLSRPAGSLFSEIAAACSWARKDAYEGIRLINVICGAGLWHEPVGEDDFRIRAVNRSEFDRLIGVASGRIRG